MLRAPNSLWPFGMGQAARLATVESKRKHRVTEKSLHFESLERRLVLDGTGLPMVNDLRLLHDTGESPSDGVTTDPRVVGSVSERGSWYFPRVEFDQNGDGMADGSSNVDINGRFEYRPDGLSLGQVWLRARAGQPGTNPGEFIFGDWSSLTFTLQANPNNSPPVVTAFGLAFDTGTSQIDAVTGDPTLSGRVGNQGDDGYLTVEIDYDGDGVADGATRTDGAGNFQFLPLGLADGVWIVRARAKE